MQCKEPLKSKSLVEVSLHVCCCYSLLGQGKYRPALELLTDILRQIKKLDDKQLLVELHLTECKIYHGLHNISKAKAALTASRSISNAIYISPKTQAQIDEMSGTLHTEEYDYETAYSYFLKRLKRSLKLTMKKMRCIL